MSIDPQLRALLAELQQPGAPGFADMSLEEVRAAVPGMAAFNGPAWYLDGAVDRAAMFCDAVADALAHGLTVATQVTT